MKITILVITTALLLTSMQQVPKSSTIPDNLLDKQNTSDDVLPNESLDPEKAISNGYIVKIDSDLVSSKTNTNAEAYNIDKLDGFMENVKNKKADNIRIVQFINNEGRTWINKLYDLEYNGEKIKYIEYDAYSYYAYSNPRDFLPSEPFYFDEVIMKDYPNDLWYAICSSSNRGNDCAPLISFNKSSIVK